MRYFVVFLQQNCFRLGGHIEPGSRLHGQALTVARCSRLVNHLRPSRRFGYWLTRINNAADTGRFAKHQSKVVVVEKLAGAV